MKSFIFSKMGHPHITIAMLGPSLMRSCEISGLDEEVLLNILPVHETSPTRFFLMGIPEKQSLRYKARNSRCFYTFEIIKF